MRLEGGGTGRLQPAVKAKTQELKQVAARVQTAQKEAMASAKAAEAHVRRLGSGALGKMDAMPWENASDNIKSTQDKMRTVTKSIKAGKVIYKGLNESTRFVAIAQKVGNGKAFQAAKKVGTDMISAAEKVGGGKAGKLVEKAGKFAEVGKAAIKGELVEHVVKTASESAFKAAEKAAVKGAVEAGGKVAAKAGAKAGAKVAGKAAGRFVPGANIAIAAYDVYKAGKTLRDPNASGWKKGTAVATAAFSVVAATNIPVVSQVAAGLSIASVLAWNVNPKKVMDGAKDVG
jgi:hypothetical protein